MNDLNWEQLFLVIQVRNHVISRKKIMIITDNFLFSSEVVIIFAAYVCMRHGSLRFASVAFTSTQVCLKHEKNPVWSDLRVKISV